MHMTNPNQEMQSSGRADARENRERILESTRKLLRERGFAVEVTDIAQEAGVGTGTLYRHSPNKEALIRIVADEMLALDVASYTRVAETEDARLAIRLLFRNRMEIVRQYGQFAVGLLGGGAPPPFRGLIPESTAGGYVQTLHDLVQRGIAQGHFRADLNVDYAVSMLLALATPQALLRLWHRRTPTQVAELDFRFYLDGLSGLAQPSSDTLKTQDSNPANA